MTFGIIKSIDGFKCSSECVTITTDTHVITMKHDNVCCSSGYLEDTGEGLVKDVIGATLLSIEELSGSNDEPEEEANYSYFFYEIKTTKGDLWSRWYGDSGQSGMYSDTIKIVAKEISGG